jgi:hypothetical protein
MWMWHVVPVTTLGCAPEDPCLMPTETWNVHFLFFLFLPLCCALKILEALDRIVQSINYSSLVYNEIVTKLRAEHQITYNE